MGSIAATAYDDDDIVLKCHGPTAEIVGRKTLITNTDDDDRNPRLVDLTVNKLKVIFKIDIGVDVNFQNVHNQMKQRTKLRDVNGNTDCRCREDHCLYQLISKTHFKITDYIFSITVTKCNWVSLLSRGVSKNIGLVKSIDMIKGNAFDEIGKPVDCDPIRVSLREVHEPYPITVPCKIGKTVRMHGKGHLKRKIKEPTD